MPRLRPAPAAAPASARGLRRFLGLCVLLAVGLAAPRLVRAQSVRSLDWTAFSVEARLDTTGTLHVRERQTILFNGDWNGGERQFTVRQGQQFTFVRIARIDSITGAEIEMQDGALELMDGYQMTDRRTLRWRSRLPTDVPFTNTKITYVIEYTYANILRTRGSAYQLDHEFAFRDRVGTIANFDLTVRLDPGWTAPAGFTGQFHQAVLEPGVSFVVNTPLEWRGVGVPSAVRRSPPVAQRMAVAAALLVGLCMMLVRFLRREQVLGRFAPITPRSVIDRTWLESRVLSMPPELVGYAWDEEAGAPEVSAVLARLVHEKKLTSRVETKGWKMFKHPVLHLEMLVSRQDFHGYERALIDAFFASGSTTTSTEEVRERYKKTGFDPAKHLRGPLKAQFEQTFGADDGTPTPPRLWPLTLALAVASIAVIAYALVSRPADTEVVVIALVAGGVPLFVFARIAAHLWRRRVVRPTSRLSFVFGPVLLCTAVLCWALTTGYGMLGLLTLTGVAMLVLTATFSVVNGARWVGTRSSMARRKELAAAREYCREELQQPAPALDDSWYPYLLAFGLNRQVEQWFRAFDGESQRRRQGTRAGQSWVLSEANVRDSGTTSTSGPTFSGFGGGGGFSGGGATVEFGSAVSAFSSAVSAPSSSSSSGGGRSSSGGSSGGGGGGGW